MNFSTPASVPSSEPLRRRLARGVALLGLALILTILLGLLLLSSSTLLANAVAPIFTGGQDDNHLAGWITLAFFVVVPVGVLVAAWRLRLRSWWWVGGGYLAVVPVLVYLAIDDPVLLHPVTIEEIAPAFPGAEKSYAVLMQYSKQRPSDEAKAFAKWKQRIIAIPTPDKPAEWNAFLIKHRADIEADWADLAPQRRWFAELNTFDRLGDLGEANFSANIPTYQVWRVMAQRSVHVAGLRMLDGQPDEAIETLLPILQAGRKLQPSARTLVRYMIGIVVEKMPLEYAARIVETATVAPQTKAKLAAAIAGGVRGEAGVRRLVAVDATAMSNTLVGEMAKFDYRGFRSLYPLVFNPRRSANLLSDLNRELQELAVRREFSASRADQIREEKTRRRFKNFFGAMSIDMWTPAYDKVVRSYWDLHDAREKLSARLAAAP
jgi:hypothetical protein